MDDVNTEHLELVNKHACFILLEKAVPAGKLKQELISLTTIERRYLTLSTPNGFSTCPLKIPRYIFDSYVAEQYIEQLYPEDADGRILFGITDKGKDRVGLAQVMDKMAGTVRIYSDSD